MSRQSDVQALIDAVIAMRGKEATEPINTEALMAANVSAAMLVDTGWPPEDTETITNKQVASFSTTTAGALKKLVIGIEAVQTGSGDPSSQNIRPIVGWSGTPLYRTGVNIYDTTTYPLTQGKWIDGDEGGQSNGASYASTTNFIPIYGLAGKKLTLNKRPGGGKPGFAFYASNTYASFISGVKNNSATAGEPMTVTVPAGTTHFRFTVPADATDIQIEIGEESTTYAAYAGTVLSAGWTGTVYGGELDWKTGKLTVTHGVIASYNGETLPGAWISDRDVYAAGTTPTTGAQVVYELATPTTTTLTGLTAVTALNGANNVWAGSGKVIKLTYIK